MLSSIEETLRFQKAQPTPTAYLAALLALLGQARSTGSQDQSSKLITSTVYLLDVVAPYAPLALLRTHFTQILSLIAPLISSPEVTTPLLKSSIGCLESLLAAQDAAAWTLTLSQNGPRQPMIALLALAVDNRPKIRKRAQEALAHILTHPPKGPALDHPAADLCAATTMGNLMATADAVDQSRKQRPRTDSGHDPAVLHALQLTKTVAKAQKGWPSKKIEPLCEVLLSISKSSNAYLVMGAFEVFEIIFDNMLDELTSSKLPRLLDAIMDLKPAQNDSRLLPSWIAVLSRGFDVAAQVSPEDTFLRLPELFDLVSGFLTSSSHNIRVSSSECLMSFFVNCIPDAVILKPSIYDEKVLQQIGDRANGLLAVKYQSAWMEVFKMLAALFTALRWRGDPFLLPIVATVGELRANDAFQGKREADDVLGNAIRSLGPGVVLSVLPHNLNKPKAGQPGRAWLLPLLRDHVSNANLTHFKNDLVPLSETMYQRVLENGDAKKTMQIKIFETVVQQVWATLPGYCDLPLDLQMAIDQDFAELISNLLYKQPELRGELCRGLQNLVESNQAVVRCDIPDEQLFLEKRMSKIDAAKNIQHLAMFASNFLAVLSNVYSQTLPQHRAYILQCINAYLSIMSEKDLVDTFDRVSSMLDSSLPKADAPPPPKTSPLAEKLPPTSHTLLDLVIALSVHLPRGTFSSLFSIASHILTNPLIIASDAQLIKKAYKLIPRLATSQNGIEALKARNAELQSLLISTADKTPVPARRDRLLALNTLITYLPTSDLHFIPSILSEVVLACKDSNEKARQAGFALLIRVANCIVDAPEGMVIRISQVPRMSADAPDADATLDEVFTMVSAGLAGVAPHMVAASIAALARLLFEFHKKLKDSVLESLCTTVEVFLQSNNREIVRSVLGFAKVEVVVLEADMLRKKMPSLVPGLMVWSKENKGRLRSKVKGILERCVRRFGAEDMERWVGADDRKIINNIRKRRERSKKKRKGGAPEGDSGSEDDDKRSRIDDEFDEAVYGSEDENEDDLSGSDDGEHDCRASRKPLKRPRSKAQFIREDDADEPLDLLAPNALANVASGHEGRFKGGRDIGKRKTKAKINEDGKLVLGENDDESQDGDVPMGAPSDGDGGREAVSAYVDAVDGPNSVRRGQRGRLKVASGNQRKVKVASEDRMDLDVEGPRTVVQSVTSGSARGGPRDRSGQGKPSQRRGLGAEKSRHGGGREGGRGRIEKRDAGGKVRCGRRGGRVSRR